MPARIGDYEVLGLLGQGGPATVYRAWHPRMSKEVAIKRLSVDDDCAKSALAKETLCLCSVQHPALPDAYDIITDKGATYLAMELIHGEPLSQCQPRLGIVQICEIARQLTSAVVEIHDNQLLHLDISPNNVLLDESGRCRLIDFGLACRMMPFQPSGCVVTGGTPGFIAPEILLRPQILDGRADVYGIGALIHFLLTGLPPQFGPRDETVWSNPPNHQLAARLWAVCVRAITTEPSERFRSAREMGAALDSLLKPSRSRRGLLAASVAASLLIGANRSLVGPVHAEVVVGSGGHARPLAASRDIRLGDHIAFSFDWHGDSAGLAVRTPSGRVVPMKPFVRAEGRAFRYPVSGGDILRQEAGTYVAYFAPIIDAHLDASFVLMQTIDRLPPPPALQRGEHLLAVAEAEVAPATDTPNGERTAWRNAVAAGRRVFPGLSAIAFHVD